MSLQALVLQTKASSENSAVKRFDDVAKVMPFPRDVQAQSSSPEIACAIKDLIVKFVHNVSTHLDLLCRLLSSNAKPSAKALTTCAFSLI